MEKEFAKYSCYYCRKMIISAVDLEDHKPVCNSTKDFSIYPCDLCGAKCANMIDLEGHRTAYHQPDMRKHVNNSNLNYDEEDAKYCDFCDMKFGTLGGLRNHIRNLHKEMLAGHIGTYHVD